MSPSLSNTGIPSPSKLSKPIIVHDHDVLSGRGVNIAQHPGNQRFRTLITTFRDQEYCTTYSAGEKRAVALQIIQHIKKLDPPGRFLKRDGRGQGTKGLNGPWDELSERESIKKTCQALRDCNRQDRQGYAKGVAAPGDVIKVVQEVRHIPAKDRAAAAAHAIATEARTSAFNAITVAATNNSRTLPKAPDSVNETSSNVSMSSSTKRPRDPEANSSTTATTMAETVESGTMNISPFSYNSLFHVHPSNQSSLSSRYSQQSNSAPGALSASNYHLPGSQSSYHYQQQQSHNPYDQILPHHNNSSSYMSAYSGASNSQNGSSYPSVSSAAATYLHSNASNHSTEYNPFSSQAQLFQDGALSGPNSNAHSGNNPATNRLHQQQHQNYFSYADTYGENSHQHASTLSTPNVEPLEDQMIKKQRTEDTEASTGPSEPSPLNDSVTNIRSNSNGSNTTTRDQQQTSFDHLAHHPSIANNTDSVASLSSKHDPVTTEIKKEDALDVVTRMKSEVNGDAFFHDDDDRNNIDPGEADAVGNDDHSWANERNSSSIHGNDQFHEALGSF